MAEEKKLIPEFYEIPAKDIMDKRVRELPLIEKDAGIDRVLSVLTESDHVWVVESRGGRKLVGIITEHDILGNVLQNVTFISTRSNNLLHDWSKFKRPDVSE